ncbi:hypothetical protein EJP77_18665 [Paenibacillus zeisoli]|uniref:C2H2-type domain-containing protein n=1 Tax=Paenibacillus zeisoli TaxID=2496267 RepID=A0A433X1P3_9BACL|nr:hypothetical protein [Paenibacillus zeisoli]RUT28039.1 hypothetical protein EJP77_18665 [Paenibacillus zeisoli]
MEIILGIGLFSLIILMCLFFACMYLLKAYYGFTESKEEKQNPMMSCYVCEKSISKTAKMCPHCGEHYGDANNTSYPVFDVIATLFFLFFAFAALMYLIEIIQKN